MIHKLMTRFARAAASAALMALTVVPAAFADGGIKVGTLVCEPIRGTRTNLILRSTTDVNCKFEYGQNEERYIGETGIALGVDLDFNNLERMVFAVVSLQSDAAPQAHALAGKYHGGHASASLGVGLGASALVGGGKKNFALEPIALHVNEGVGVKSGIGFLYLEPSS